jgi:hypothetical protein
MDTPAQQLHRFYVDAMLVPGALTFALVVFLMVLGRKRPDVPGVWIWVVLVLAFFTITCLPHAKQLLFPMPCTIRFVSPTDMCNFGPAVRLKAGVLAGALGAIIAFVSMKSVLFIRHRAGS